MVNYINKERKIILKRNLDNIHSVEDQFNILNSKQNDYFMLNNDTAIERMIQSYCREKFNSPKCKGAERE
jgi:hypothetical protein